LITYIVELVKSQSIYILPFLNRLEEFKLCTPLDREENAQAEESIGVAKSTYVRKCLRKGKAIVFYLIKRTPRYLTFRLYGAPYHDIY